MRITRHFSSHLRGKTDLFCVLFITELYTYLYILPAALALVFRAFINILEGPKTLAINPRVSYYATPIRFNISYIDEKDAN